MAVVLSISVFGCELLANTRSLEDEVGDNQEGLLAVKEAESLGFQSASMLSAAAAEQYQLFFHATYITTSMLPANMYGTMKSGGAVLTSLLSLP
jgi:hypothetical protein